MQNSLSLNVVEGLGALDSDPASMQRMHLRMEKLQLGLQQRTIEFKRLQGQHTIGEAEKRELKERLDELTRDNGREKEALEALLHRTIHSHSGLLSQQRQEYARLQTALTVANDEKLASIAYAKRLAAEHAAALASQAKELQAVAQRSASSDVDERLQTLADERAALATTVDSLRGENTALSRAVDSATLLREEDCSLLVTQAKALQASLATNEARGVALAACVESLLLAQSEIAAELAAALDAVRVERGVAAAACDAQATSDAVAAERGAELAALQAKQIVRDGQPGEQREGRCGAARRTARARQRCDRARGGPPAHARRRARRARERLGGGDAAARCAPRARSARGGRRCGGC